MTDRDCNDIERLEAEMLRMKERTEEIAKGRYTPFFTTVGFFLVVMSMAWSNMRSIEHEIDGLDIEIALALNDAMQYRKDIHDAALDHSIIHRREREAIDRIREFINEKLNVVIKEGQE
jgi:hypothetical protein